MVVGDRGFFSARKEREAEKMGVKKVALPARGRSSQKTQGAGTTALVSTSTALGAKLDRAKIRSYAS